MQIGRCGPRGEKIQMRLQKSSTAASRQVRRRAWGHTGPVQPSLGSQYVGFLEVTHCAALLALLPVWAGKRPPGLSPGQPIHRLGLPVYGDDNDRTARIIIPVQRGLLSALDRYESTCPERILPSPYVCTESAALLSRPSKSSSLAT